MSLLVSENETFEIKVKYVAVPDGIKCFEENEQAPLEAVCEWFRFKKPNWEETCEMMSYAMVPYNGSVILNPYRFVDAKLKVLMTAWSIKDDKGNPVDCKPSNIAKLNPAVCEYLSKKLDVAAMPNLSGTMEQAIAEEPTKNDEAPAQTVKKGKVKKTKEPKAEAKKPEEAPPAKNDEPRNSFFEEDKKDEPKPEQTTSSPTAGLQETQEMPKPSPEAPPQ